MGKPYIKLAHLRGISGDRTAVRYVGRNAILPYSNQNWGVMLNAAYNNISLTNVNQLFYLFEPMITGLSVGLILFAQGLDRLFNVRLQARHEKEGKDTESVEEV